MILSTARIVLCLLVSTASAVAAPLTLHVSTAGNDSWSGTRAEPAPDRSDGPLATLGAARSVVRKAGASAGARILIHGGTYRLSEPLVFADGDSGSSATPQSYEAYAGEKVILSGTRLLQGRWQPLGGNIYSLDVGREARGGETFRTLFVDGKRATWARFPNHGFLRATGGQGKNILELPAGTAKPSWASDPNATVNVIADRGWYNEIVRIAGVSASGGRIELVGRELQGAILAGNRFYVEGIREELDEEGEWYLDRTAGKLYYYSAVSPQGRRFEAAVVDRLIDVRGSVRQPVHDLAFRGLEFFGSDFTVDHVAVRTNQDAAIHLTNAQRVEITDCRFAAVGGYAVWLHLDARDNVIRRNEIVDGGAGGVLLTAARFSYQSDKDVFETAPEVQQVAPIGNVIAENHIHHGGVVRSYCSGIHLDSRPLALAQARGNYIGFNHIHDLPRNGIFAFRNQGGNIFEANHIHDVIQRTNDGGAVHLASMNPLCAPTYIVDNRIYRVGYQGGERSVDLSFGIYPDWFTSRMVIRGNVVTDTRDGAIRLLGGDDALIEDNLLGDDPTGAIVFGCWSTRSIKRIVLRNNTVANGKGPWLRYYGERGEFPLEVIAAHPEKIWTSTGNTFWGRAAGGGILLAKSSRGPMQKGDRTFTLAEWQKNGSEQGSTIRDLGADGSVNVSTDPASFGLGSPTFRRMEKPRATEAAQQWLRELAGTAAFVAFDDAHGITTAGHWEAEPTKISEFLAFADLKQAVSREQGSAITFTTDELPPGAYAVFVKWYGAPNDRAPTIEVEFSAGSARAQIVRVDHRQEAHKWLQIGVVESLGAGKAKLTMRNLGGGMAAINSVAWVKVQTPSK